MMRPILISFLAFFLLLQQVAACDCKMIPLSEKTLTSSELIFLGKVIAISGCNKTAKVSFAIDELYRGKSFSNVEIEFDCSSDCQMSFVPGQTWLIYATYKSYGKAEVGFCSYSRQQFANEKEDYNTSLHGMTFSDEKIWLKKTLGVQTLNVKDPVNEEHHENIRPQGMQVLVYLAIGFISLIAIYFVGRKYLK